MLAVFDATQQRIRMAQQFVGLADIAFGYQLADDGTADCSLSTQLAHLDAQLLSVAHVIVETFLAVVSKAVVVTRQQHAHAPLVSQHLFHKLPCRQGLQFRGKCQHFHAVDACLADKPDFLLQRRQHLFLTGRVVERNA